MDAKKFNALIRRRMPYLNITVQCDAETTPEHLREHGFVCAIVTWCPERADDGNVIEEGFHDPQAEADKPAKEANDDCER